MEWYIAAGFNFEKMPMYNCRAVPTTEAEWYAKGRRSPILGALFLLYGVIVELMYIPCLLVITRPQFAKLSCYKIMAILGLIDMAAISVNSILTGYLMMEGSMFCHHPHLNYVAGAIGLGLWCSACMSCLILVINRLVDMWKPHMMDPIFGGKRTYYVMLFPILYGVYFVFFTPPLIFQSNHTAWFFSPAIFEESRDAEYLNYPHTANNLLIVVATCWLYTALCYVLASKFKTDESASKMSWTQKSIFIQATLICLANLIAALIYVYMQFFYTPDFFILIGHINWQWGHGFPAIVYLALNKTIQREVGRMLGLYRMGIIKPSVTPSTHQNHDHTSSIHI